jgi:hypothetical protein
VLVSQEAIYVNQFRKPSYLDSFLLELGLFREASMLRANGAPQQYYWFKCPHCHNIAVNYYHGFRKELPCKICEVLSLWR